MEKKSIWRTFLLIVLLSVMVLLMASCSVFKEHRSSNDTSSKEKTEITTDTKSEIKTSEPIKDNIVINVPKSDNEAVNKALDAVLSQINTSKTSGSNSYKSFYDSETGKLLIEFLIGQTQNVKNENSTDTKSEKSFEERTDEYIEKKVKRIPWWVFALVGLWFLPSIIERLKLIINPLLLLMPKKQIT